MFSQERSVLSQSMCPKKPSMCVPPAACVHNENSNYFIIKKTRIILIIKKLADSFQFVDNFLLLDASVLKPYSDLPLGQVGLSRYPPPFVLRDKFIGAVLALELLQLHLGVWHALLSSASERAGVPPGVCHCV